MEFEWSASAMVLFARNMRFARWAFAKFRILAVVLETHLLNRGLGEM
jgi:hypothetical protein